MGSLFRRNLQRLIRGHLHPNNCGSKYEPLSYHVFHHRTYSKWDCIGGAQTKFSEVRTPRHLLLSSATLMHFYYLKLKIIISIAGYPWTAKTHLENDILPSPTIGLTQLQLRKDLKFKGFNKITTHYTSLHGHSVR